MKEEDLYEQVIMYLRGLQDYGLYMPYSAPLYVYMKIGIYKYLCPLLSEVRNSKVPGMTSKRGSVTISQRERKQADD